MDDPDQLPAPERVWAQWLYGDHAAGHRQAVLREFAADFLPRRYGREVKAAVQVLASVKVLGEGVDTARCDAVAFMDARGPMVDIVQMVGRALRIRQGEGKLATLVVPLFMRPGENPSEMLTSPAYSTLSKVLSALRAHDPDTIEALADPRVRSGSWGPDGDLADADETTDADADTEGVDGVEDEDVDGVDGADAAGVSGAAAELLRFSTPRDPALLAQFIQLRILDPEKAYWRRGIAACLQYLKETGAEELQAPYRYVTPDDWAPRRLSAGGVAGGSAQGLQRGEPAG